MKRTLSPFLFLLLLSSLHADWLAFRGSQGNGSFDQTAPASLSLKSRDGWSQALPGRGLSSPILVGDLVVLTASSGPNQETLHILAFDARSGSPQWERKFKATGRTICHEKTCVAACTLVSDGKALVAQFSSNDVFCLDLQGQLLWLRGLTFDYPNAANGLGMSSSPVLAEGVAIIQVENDADSFTFGLDLANGATLWKKDRPRGANWTSPIVMRTKGREIVALQSKDGLSAIEPSSGEEIWSFDGGASTIPSSAWSQQGLVLVPSNGLTALKMNATGERPEKVWTDNKLKPGTGSPTVVQDKVYVVNGANVLSCAEITSGKILWRLRLKGPVSSSPVANSDRLFLFSETGLGQVVGLDKPEGEVVGTVDLEDTILCTPALASDGLFVRSDNKLWKLCP
ncbi:MAG: PQQ-binding-like beta-propeller repeat protein [Opitutales bacterium]